MGKTLALNSTVVAVVAGALAVGAISLPLLLPSPTIESAGRSASSVARPAPPSDSILAPSAVAPQPESSEVVTPPPSPPVEVAAASPQEILTEGLENYRASVSDSGGVRGSFVSADGLDFWVARDESGNVRASLETPEPEEVVRFGDVWFARMSNEELEAYQSGDYGVPSKPNAAWVNLSSANTEVAEDMQTLLSPSNLAQAVKDLSPVMVDVQAVAGPDGEMLVQGVIRPSDIPSLPPRVIRAYNLKSSVGGEEPVAVVYSLSANSVLRGFVVQPPAGAQPVSMLVDSFSAVEIREPASSVILTADDIDSVD